ncbi:beta-adaptin [Serendipita sp. 398]|nr:beta-adaptin [Serendipita sp. 398]
MDIHIASQNLAESGAEGAEATKVEWHINTAILNKLLIALNECSEWGRVAILTQLARYTAVDERESEHICERVVPQLQHANGSVVLSAVKVIMIHMRNISAARADLEKQLIRKMAPPLVTLVSSAPEVQWVALRNINLLLQKRDDLLQNEMRVFFCKYNDPPYVKVEKLAIMVRLAGENNVDTLLSELREYASEVDVDFVRRSIKAIGQCAVKIESSAERCVGVLMDLINTRVSYVVQEAVVVVKDIFRKYPATYEGVIPTLCANLEELDEPEAKASLIWIIGEYAEKIDNAEELLGIFVDSFTEDPYPVRWCLPACGQ